MQDAEESHVQRTFSKFSKPSLEGEGLMPDSFTIRDLAATLAKILDLQDGSTVEIQRDRANPNRVMVVKLVD
jgi:hypothetical protein